MHNVNLATYIRGDIMWSVQPKLFGWFHILSMVLGIAFGYAGVVLGRKFKAEDGDGRKAKLVLWIIEVMFIVLEAAKEIFYAIENRGYRWDLFPMQICSIIFIVLPIALICKDGLIKDSVLGFIGFCSLAGASFYLCNPTAAFGAEYILLSLHSVFWHLLMILTGTFIIVGYELLSKNTIKILLGSFAVWFAFAIIAAVINNIAYVTVPELNIDYYHIGYVKVIYPVLNLIFKYPEPYIPFFLCFVVYFALGTIGVYYAGKGICKLNHKIFKKDQSEAADETR